MKKELFMFVCSFVCIFILTSCSANTENLVLSSTNAESESLVQMEGERGESINTYESDVDESMLDSNKETEIIESTPGSNEESVTETVTTENIPESEETMAETEDAKPDEHPDNEFTTEASASIQRIPYELESITEKYYEKNGSYIEFNDLPENDAETIACLNLLYRISGESWVKCGYEYYYVPVESSERSEEVDTDTAESIFEWIEVDQVNTMSLEELAECDPNHELFAILKRKLHAGGEYDDYVQMLLDNGCVVVCVKYTDKYKEGFETLQISDGEHEQHWLFVPDENEQLRVFDYTHIFAQFDFAPDAEAPDVLKWPVE